MAHMISGNPPEGYYYLLHTTIDVDGDRPYRDLYYTHVEDALDTIYDDLDRYWTNVVNGKLVMETLEFVHKTDYGIIHDVGSERLRIVLV